MPADAPNELPSILIPNWTKYYRKVPPLTSKSISDIEKHSLRDKIVIAINGPQRSGKDTAASDIMSRWDDTYRWGMSYHLKETAHANYGLFTTRGQPLPHDAFEHVKDTPIDEFGGLTPRESYIANSELLIKQFHGEQAFGVFWCRRVAPEDAKIIIVPDAGFAGEWTPILDVIPPENVILLKIHAENRGVIFKDSRGYIDLPGVETHNLENQVHGDSSKFLEAIKEITDSFIEQRTGKNPHSAADRHIQHIQV
jgi:hypothetical protein